MFSATTTITVYQSVGSHETLMTVYITNVDQTDPQDVHLIPATFLLAKQNKINSKVHEAGFEWQGETVFAGFIIANELAEINISSNADVFYNNIVEVAERFGVLSVPRIIL